MRIVVTGSNGFIGTALVAALRRAGHAPVRLVRGDAGPDDLVWDPHAGRIDAGLLRGVDAVVHLAGAGIGDHRWTDEYRQEILTSRTRSTNLLSEAIAALDDGPRTMISASGIDYYGDRGDDVLDESASRGRGFLADVVAAWEDSTRAAEAAGARVVHARTAMVLGRHGGALPRLARPFRLGAGGRFGSGRQWTSWITLGDHVRAVLHLLDSSLAGAVNMAAPNPVRNAELATTLGAVLHRPAVVPAPATALRAVLGRDRADALLLESKRVVPAALLADGFTFRYPDLRPALEAILAGAPTSGEAS